MVVIVVAEINTVTTFQVVLCLFYHNVFTYANFVKQVSDLLMPIRLCA